ncbi:hypothetical protein LEP1GSC061_3805 [Leptospira wolffii serovar Khorat str. Khorat-H2]|nr:hypothetical protein LEP1GSC061_3805 [Leptospira wolffii serovar Khorat str. Khorat-H2]
MDQLYHRDIPPAFTPPILIHTREFLDRSKANPNEANISSLRIRFDLAFELRIAESI